MCDLGEIKESLITLDYPGINSMKIEKDILNIIGPENRKTFLKWVFVKLDSQVFINLDEENIIKELPELIENHGFCPDEETTKFIDGSLDFESQFKIIERILNFLILCKSSNQGTTPRPHKDLNSILKQIDQVFPNLQYVTEDFTELGESLKKENAILLKELEELEKTKLIDLALEGIKEPNLDELQKKMDQFQIKCASITDKPKKEIFENQSVKVFLK
ncbi:uncharacterized protein [Onthophagus taurus]|uniref:uncharacterized protein n=1 Tax=Onthophagus taurus TaxID=166361 RepID=UPI0039BE1A92